jgi:hypothetical protein
MRHPATQKRSSYLLLVASNKSADSGYQAQLSPAEAVDFSCCVLRGRGRTCYIFMVAVINQAALTAAHCRPAGKLVCRPFAPSSRRFTARRAASARPRASAEQQYAADVVVVGAGVAGLNAAATLHKAGKLCCPAAAAPHAPASERFALPCVLA